MENKGFIIILALIFFSICSYLAFRKVNFNLIRRNLKCLQKTECLGFRREEFSIRKYFIRNYFVKKSRAENYNKLLSFIDDNNENELFNRYDHNFISNKFNLKNFLLF